MVSIDSLMFVLLVKCYLTSLIMRVTAKPRNPITVERKANAASPGSSIFEPMKIMKNEMKVIQRNIVAAMIALLKRPPP